MNNHKARNLYSKDFCLMVVGQIITVFGTALLRFGFSLFILDITGREDLYATLYALSSIPLLFSPIGGAIADRFNRKKIMVFIDVANGTIVLGAVSLLSSETSFLLWVGTVMILLGILSAIEYPNTMAALPSIVPTNRLEQANGIINGVQMLSNIVAPVLGGMLYTILGVKALMVTSSVAFFLAAIMECFINIPFTTRKFHKPMVTTITQDLKEGFFYVIKQSFIRNCMILAALINLFLTPLFVIGTPIILRITLQSNDIAYGVGMSVIQVSTILGALTIGKFSKIIKTNQLYLWLIMTAIFTLPIAVSVTPLNGEYYSQIIMFFVGAAPISVVVSSISIIIITRVQKQTPDHLMGKVMAIITGAVQCMAPMGQFIYGVLFRAFSSEIYIPILCIFTIMLLLSVITKMLLGNERSDY